MNKTRIDLNLFGEEGVCAAEQTTASVTEGEAECDNSLETFDNSENTEKKETGDAVSRIARLLSCEGIDEEAIVKTVNAKRARAALAERLRRRSAIKAYVGLISEAEQLSSKIKGFDLRTELADKRFRAMLHSGLSLEDAWRAVHIDRLLEEAKEIATQEAIEKTLAGIKSGTVRPEENGTAGKAPANSRTSVDSLTGRGIRDILRRVENGAKIKF